MAQPYLSEIRIMSFSLVPEGWAPCNGQIVPISQFPALFALLGTTFGGDGHTTFAFPDLRGRVPMHFGNGYALGARGGEAAHQLSVAELPTHSHVMMASESPGIVPTPGNAVLAVSPSSLYSAPTDLVPLSTQSIEQAGASQPHPNVQPYLTLAFCIATSGVYPTPP